MKLDAIDGPKTPKVFPHLVGHQHMWVVGHHQHMWVVRRQHMWVVGHHQHLCSGRLFDDFGIKRVEN